MPHSFALHTTTCARTAEAGSQENLLQYGRKLDMAHSSLQKGYGPWATHEPAEGIGPVVSCLHLDAEQTCVLGEAGQAGQLACAQHVLSTTTPLTSYLWGLAHVLKGHSLGARNRFCFPADAAIQEAVRPSACWCVCSTRQIVVSCSSLSLILMRAAQKAVADTAESPTVRWWKHQRSWSAKMVCGCMGVVGAHATASGTTLQASQHMQLQLRSCTSPSAARPT